MESESASVQTGRPLSVPNVSENKGPFWCKNSQSVNKNTLQDVILSVLTYILKTMHVSWDDSVLTGMHIYTDIISQGFSATWHLPCAREDSMIRREKSQRHRVCSCMCFRYWQPGSRKLSHHKPTKQCTCTVQRTSQEPYHMGRGSVDLSKHRLSITCNDISSQWLSMLIKCVAPTDTLTKRLWFRH